MSQPNPSQPVLPTPPDAAKVLQQILPKKVLIYLALISFGLSLILFLMGAFLPGQFAMPGPRFCLFGATALCLAVFLFLIFPERFEPTTIPALNASIKLGGPPALFFFTVIFLNYYYPVIFPRERHVRFDFAGKKGPPPTMLAIRTKNDEPFRHLINPTTGEVTGVLILFTENRPVDLIVGHTLKLFDEKTERIDPGFDPLPLMLTYKPAGGTP